MRKILLLAIALVTLGASAVFVVPRAEHALALRLAADDPARLADLRLRTLFSVEAASQEIEAALAADDVELAESFVTLAEARGLQLPPPLVERVRAFGSARAQFRRTASRFGKGFISGDPDGLAGLAGAATGDLLVFGDIRDLAKQGTRWARGEAVDPLMAGLATVGLAITAGTYFSSGAAAPARAGVSIFKAARRTGKVGASLAADVVRLARTGRGTKAAGALADLGRIEGKAGARAALESVRHADDVADLSKIGRVAQANGRGTLAVLKTLGRGALVLGAAAVTGALWVLGASMNIFLLIVTLSTILVWLLRGSWRTGKLAWRAGHYTVVKLTAAA